MSTPFGLESTLFNMAASTCPLLSSRGHMREVVISYVLNNLTVRMLIYFNRMKLFFIVLKNCDET